LRCDVKEISAVFIDGVTPALRWGMGFAAFTGVETGRGRISQNGSRACRDDDHRDRSEVGHQSEEESHRRGSVVPTQTTGTRREFRIGWNARR